MTANINAAPKTHAFTLIYRDTETSEIHTHQFFHHEEEIYGEELAQYLLLPATEMWQEVYKGEVDFEMVENYAATLEALAVVAGHGNIEPLRKESTAVSWNPKMNIFGKPQLRLVH